MASRGKYTLEDHQIVLRGKIIDLKRLAYDIFVYTAKKLYVPENCLYIWEGSHNNYMYPDFCRTLFTSIFRVQMKYKYTMYMYFQSRYETNKLQSDEDVCNLHLAVFKILAKKEETTIRKVEVSLVVACELIIFLYSKNASLYVKNLTDHWFEHCFRNMKKDFEAEGGFETWYKYSITSHEEQFITFCDKFILKHCREYEKSVKEKEMFKTYSESLLEYFKNVGKNHPLEVQINYSRVRYFTEYENPAPPLTSELDKASRSTANPGLGITPHEELLQQDLPLIADASSSQNVPEASPRKPTRDRKGSYSLQKRRQRKHSLCSSSESSGAKVSSGKRPSVLVAEDKTPSQNIPRTREVPTLRTGSSGQQKSTSSTSSSLDQRLRQLSLE